MKKILFILLGAVLIESEANSHFIKDDSGIYTGGLNYHMQRQKKKTAPGTAMELSSPHDLALFTYVNEGNNVYKIKMCIRDSYSSH